MKVEDEKIYINKLLNVHCGLNNLKTKVDDLDVGKLKALPVGLKKLRDMVSEKIVKRVLHSKLSTKKINLEN